MTTPALSIAPAEDDRRAGPRHRRPERGFRRVRRAVSLWDVAGLALLTFLMLCVTEVAVDHLAGGLERLRFLRFATVGTGAVAVLSIGAAVWSHRPWPWEVPARLTDLWRDPAGDWSVFALGVVLSIPLLGLYTPVVLGDADSVRIVAAVRYVQRHGFGFLIDTQDNFGPHLLLGPAVALGGIEAVRLVTIFTVQILSGVTALLARRLSGSMVAAVVAALALWAMPAVVARASYVPMYPAMLAFGYLGGWLAHRAVSDGRSWKYPVLAALCLVLSFEFQSVGQLFMVVPLLLLVTVADLRSGLRGMMKVYSATGVLCIPRLVVNLSEGGFSRLASNRTDFWINQGYIRDIQRFAGYVGVEEPVTTYLARLPVRFVGSLGPYGWVVLGLALAAIAGLRGRARIFALSCVAFMVLATTAKRVPPFPRYFSPLWPGMALLAGVLVAELVRRRQAARPVLRAGVATTITGALLAVAAHSYVGQAERTQAEARKIEAAHYRELVAMIDDGKGVIGARSHALLNVTSEVPTYGGQFLTEEEYATYLIWPSDEEVIEVLDRHDIGWVLVNPKLVLEIEYHDTWLLPNHGHRARSVFRVARSPNFCKVAARRRLILYRLQRPRRPCPLEDPFAQ